MLSIIVPWRDRNELGRAFPSLVRSVAPLGGEIVVVNFSGDEATLKALIGDATSAKIVTVQGETYFNKSAAHNIGAAMSRHEILFFCDCDVLANAEDVEKLTQSLASQSGIFATVRGVTETEANSRKARHVTCFGYTLRIRTADGRELEIIDSEEDSENGTRQAPGLLFVRKADFLRISGFNSGLLGWGWEDQDMISRLTLGQGLKRIQHGQFRHISHNDDARMAHYPRFASRWESRDLMFRKALANYDENDFRGTYDDDVRRLSKAVRYLA